VTLAFQTSSGAPCERLTLRKWRTLAGAEPVRWVRDAVEAVRTHSHPGATAIGPAVIADATVATVVTFDHEVLARRERDGVSPALDRLTLRGRLAGHGPDAQSPVRRAQFISVWGRASLTSLSRLGGYGQPLLLVTPWMQLDDLDLAECDWRGIGVVQVGPHAHLDWLVSPTVPEPAIWTNMRFEQLVDLAGASA
jgi:hypothetical protein